MTPFEEAAITLAEAVEAGTWDDLHALAGDVLALAPEGRM